MKTYEPAFPTGPGGDTMHGEDGRVWHQYPAQPGMTLLDYFAGQIAAGMAAGDYWCRNVTDSASDVPAVTGFAEAAYATAAAMLEVRKSYVKGTQ